ncbi:hypothetical protein Tco_0698194 [Tanacetum coccineum]
MMCTHQKISSSVQIAKSTLVWLWSSFEIEVTEDLYQSIVQCSWKRLSTDFHIYDIEGNADSCCLERGLFQPHRLRTLCTWRSTMGYTSVMPRRRWINLDKKRSRIMVKDIDCQLLEREAWKSLLVEGNTGKTLDCFSRQYDIVIFCSTISVAGVGIASIKRCRRDLSSDGVRNLATASGRGRLKEDLESSMWRRHQDYKATPNTIELPIGNNVVPLRSDTIRLVQNECSFHGLWSEDPNQHLKDFLKLVDSLNLDGRAAELRNDILMFHQHQGESLSEAWTHFNDLLQKVPHHGIDLLSSDLTNKIACRKFLIKKRRRFFTDAGDGGRKAHFLEDKQIPSVGVFDEVFSILKAFGRNTHDFGSFGEETDKAADLHQHLSRISTQQLETTSQITRDAVTTHTKTASQDIKTASECMTQPII